MLYTPPSEFITHLKETFPDYRLRWSLKTHRWHLEQKVGRGALDPYYIDPYDDSLIRARDGYWLIMEISPREVTKCEECGFELNVPLLRFAEVRCDYCYQKEERDARWMLGWFPLGERLIDYLKWGNPVTGGAQRLSQWADEQNQQRLATARRDGDNYTEALWRDSRNAIMGVSQVGYGS